MICIRFLDFLKQLVPNCVRLLLGVEDMASLTRFGGGGVLAVVLLSASTAIIAVPVTVPIPQEHSQGHVVRFKSDRSCHTMVLVGPSLPLVDGANTDSTSAPVPCRVIKSTVSKQGHRLVRSCHAVVQTVEQERESEPGSG